MYNLWIVHSDSCVEGVSYEPISTELNNDCSQNSVFYGLTTPSNTQPQASKIQIKDATYAHNPHGLLLKLSIKNNILVKE